MKKINVLLICFITTFFSCSEWLDVKPQTESELDQMFSDQSGFKDALTGCYIQLKSENLYGKQLTWNGIEYLAQLWDHEEDELSGQMSIYNWQDAEVESLIVSIYKKFYRGIAEVNLILDNIDQRKSVFKDEKLFSLIKGEALGIRAYCHFDVLRLYGPIPTETTGEVILPYVKTVQHEGHKHVPYVEYVSLLKQDIDAALALLENSDPLVKDNASNDNYFKYRELRMNYYALVALKARVHLWLGEEDECLACCNQILDSKKYELGNLLHFDGNEDYTFSKEHLSAVYEYELPTIATENFTEKGDLSKNRIDIETLYTERSTDIRFITLWRDFEIQGGMKCTLIKYHQPEEEEITNSIKQRNQIPLIRLSEIYFMAAECGDFDCFEKYAISRRINPMDQNNEAYTTKESMKSRLIDEYAREFYGEGQLFYQYKRWNLKNIRWYHEDMTKENYVLPLPIGEN